MTKFVSFIIAAAAMGTLAGCAAESTDAPEATTQESQLSCANPDGTNAMIAALTAAMANELHRWELTTDFYLYRGTYNQEMIALTSTGLAQCSNGCDNVKTLLAFQDPKLDQILTFGTQKLSAWSFASRTATGFRNMVTYKQNHMYPYDAHKLTLISTNPGGCDTMFNYNATTPSGGQLAHPANLVNAIQWTFANGPNPYINFTNNGNSVSIDPTGTVVDGDDSTSGASWGCQQYKTGISPDPTGESCSCNGVNGHLGHKPGTPFAMLVCM